MMKKIIRTLFSIFLIFNLFNFNYISNHILLISAKESSILIKDDVFLEENEISVRPQGAITGAYIVKVVIEGIIVGYVTVSVIEGVIAGITNTDGLSDVIKQQVRSYIGRPYHYGMIISGTSGGSGGGSGAGGFRVTPTLNFE